MPEAAADEAAARVIAWLESRGSTAVRDGMARFALPPERAFGIPLAALRIQAKRLGRHHALAASLWASGWYEARLLACFVDDPAQVDVAQMDRWCADFDNWAIVDTACTALFAATPHAWGRVAAWACRAAEFEKRAGFALLWSLAAHDKTAEDARFIEGLASIEHAADDPRNFVKKAVNMALRAIGKRNPALHAAAVEVALRLAAQKQPAPHWIGKHALAELTSPAIGLRLARRTRSRH